MRTSLESHHSIIDTGASIHPSSPAFKIPNVSQAGVLEAWVPISYRQLRNDVDCFARYWTHSLRSVGVHRKTVVALWLQGTTYCDVLHILGLSRAGYIPQLLYCSTNPFIVTDLLRRGRAQALIHDRFHAAHIPSIPIPTFDGVDARFLATPNISLPLVSVDPDGVAFLFHTAGTTLGIPKLVPCTYRTLGLFMQKIKSLFIPRNSSRQDVYSWRSTICHMCSFLALLGKLSYGSCIIQPTRPDFSSNELVDMITRGGVNRLHRSTTFLSSHIKEFRKNRNLLHLLSGLDEIVPGGRMLGKDDEDWLTGNNLPLRTVFGTSEVPMIMTSGSDARNLSLLRPLDGVGICFVPFCATPSMTPQTYGNVNTKVVELVITSDSPFCPDPSLRDEDGHFHSGDLFLEASPGLYAFRGRIHDWLHADNGQSFDAKAIEDNIRLTCGEFIAECVVVGNNRPSPVAIVEPTGAQDPDWVKRQIIRGTRHFHSRNRFPHERITSCKFVVVVTGDIWPRTPMGLIRRQDVENKLKADLDNLYASVSQT